MNDIKFGKYLKKIRKKYNFSKEYVANILKVKESDYLILEEYDKFII